MLNRALQRARDLAERTGRGRVANFARMAARLTEPGAERLRPLAAGYCRSAAAELSNDWGDNDSRRRLLDLLDLVLGNYRPPEASRSMSGGIGDAEQPRQHAAKETAPCSESAGKSEVPR